MHLLSFTVFFCKYFAPKPRVLQVIAGWIIDQNIMVCCCNGRIGVVYLSIYAKDSPRRMYHKLVFNIHDRLGTSTELQPLQPRLLVMTLLEPVATHVAATDD